jgi:hypothetical protein
MSSVADGKFPCGSCGKRFTWKPQIAGKSAKCSCGQTFTVPASVAQSDEDAMYELKEDLAPPTPVARPRVTKLAPQQAPNPADKTLGYQRGPNRAEKKRAASETFFNKTKDIYIPAGMLVFGFLAILANLLFNERIPFAHAIIALPVLLGIEVVVLVGIAMAIANVAGVSFGTLKIGLLKLATMVVFASAVDTLVSWALDSTGVGWLLGWAASVITYIACLIKLFDMDFEDAWIVFVVISGIKMILNMFLFTVLIAYLAGGGSLPSANVPAAQRTVADKQILGVKELKDMGLLLEAREYIKGGRQAVLTEVVDKWYAAGALSVSFSVNRDINGSITPRELIAELPEDNDARAKCIGLIADYYKAIGVESPDPVDLQDPKTPYLFFDIR